MKRSFRVHVLLALLVGVASRAEAGELTIAAAADLKYALTEIADAFRAEHPGEKVDIIFGSSGKFHTQLQNGAPFDIFFSADIAYPRELLEKGLAAPAAPSNASASVTWPSPSLAWWWPRPSTRSPS